ncbi:MAG: hypothetical protein NC094_07670 [Bacteroidales bacterium]|nr:hypothetical protein [Lachnoclostridium sp.]MCM1384708.1 hypothetical protein [Lachnoclostridium sp.]MCM1465278.1 hypothetical protein [Bacteroidales bacterium]
MSLSMEFLGSEIQQGIVFRDTSNITADFIIASMESICCKADIPAKFRKDTITSGKLFKKKTYECVIINHPNPPQDYAAQVYVLAGNTILFHYAGNSKAFREKNEYEAVQKGTSTTMQSMKYMFKQPNKMALEIELAWHTQIIEAFNSLIG